MSYLAHQKNSRRVTLALVLALALASVVPVSPARAQEEERAPGFSDGQWEAVFVSNSRVGTAMGVTSGETNGTATFTVSEGLLDGSWGMSGTATVSGEASGSAEFVAEGNVGGTAGDPLFPSTGGQINMIITIDGHTGEFSQSFPASESAVSILLNGATCNQVIGEWEVSAAGMTGSGSFVATRVGDLRGTPVEDYETRVTELMVDAMDFRDEAAASGTIPSGALEALLARAQELNSELRRAVDCGTARTEDVSGFQGIIAGVVADLLQVVLDNPIPFDASELRALVNALVATGAYGIISDASADGLLLLLGANLNAAIESGDDVAISGLTGAAATLGAWDLVEIGTAALGGE